jgi:surfeit locus 1 family protein
VWQALELERYAALRPVAGGAATALPLCAAAPAGRAAGAEAPASPAASAAPCLAPWVAQQTSPAADGLVRDWPALGAGADRHRGYAVQWYALAVVAAGLSAWYAGRLLLRRLGNERNPRLAGR